MVADLIQKIECCDNGLEGQLNAIKALGETGDRKALDYLKWLYVQSFDRANVLEGRYVYPNAKGELAKELIYSPVQMIECHSSQESHYDVSPISDEEFQKFVNGNKAHKMVQSAIKELKLKLQIAP